MASHTSVVVVGGGQAGLSMSYCLKQLSIDHLIFEKEKVAHSWRSKRWDTFCLVTPNWQCTLPGYAYPGSDPQGFMQRDEIVQYVEDYARSFDPPLHEGVAVEQVRYDAATGHFAVTTSLGDYTADQVVVATGGYHQPKVPRMAERLPADVTQLHASQYKSPDALPEGGVLIVGTGQSGCQIAEDLHLAGRQVHLCVGSAPRSPRQYRGKDVVDWLDQMGYYDLPIHKHPQKEAVRTKTNHYVTGRGGGREIDLRHFAQEGMQLYGKLADIQGPLLTFADNLKRNLDQADAVAESIKQTIDRYIDANHIDAPTEPPYQPVWEPATSPLQQDLQTANIRTVIWGTGYLMDFNWIDAPVFNGRGYPGHDRGVTAVDGLYFLGLPWLYTWGSGRFSGVARDAHYLADRIALRHQMAHPSPTCAAYAADELALGGYIMGV